jgi:plasmid stabilization system protein ParE
MSSYSFSDTAIRDLEEICNYIAVERGFSETIQRRLTRYYEKLPATSETLIYLAMIRIMVRRLA